jgi:hypothetical protein
MTIGGAIAGNCDLGRVLMASIPTKRITNENTIASAGLLRNILNII